MPANFSEPECCENGGEIISETENKNEHEDKEAEKDLFLQAFLIGYKKEKDRRQRINAAREEREKKEIDKRRIDEEWRREEREEFENRMMKEMVNVKRTLEARGEEEKKLRVEIEELRKESKEGGLVKVIVEIVGGVGSVKEINAS